MSWKDFNTFISLAEQIENGKKKYISISNEVWTLWKAWDHLVDELSLHEVAYLLNMFEKEFVRLKLKERAR